MTSLSVLEVLLTALLAPQSFQKRCPGRKRRILMRGSASCGVTCSSRVAAVSRNDIACATAAAQHQTMQTLADNVAVPTPRWQSTSYSQQSPSRDLLACKPVHPLPRSTTGVCDILARGCKDQPKIWYHYSAPMLCFRQHYIRDSPVLG